MISNRLRRSAVASAFLFLSFTVSASSVRGQTKQLQYSRDELIVAAREIMTTARYCALITTDSAGRTHARAMDPFPPEADMTVWLGTNSSSRKVSQIRRHPRVTLYYFNREDQEYVTLSGLARLVNDPKEKAKRWKDEWTAFYPNREKDYVLIVVTPKRMEVVSEKKGVIGDPRTWKPPSINFRRRQANIRGFRRIV